MARRMDTQPIEWSESDEGMAEILDVMRAEHAKRWSAGTTILPWTDAGARQLVLLACRRSRAKAAKNSG
jgi:deoxyribodipyrimidine photolyase